MNDSRPHLIVVGGGFAGFWACAAASASRHRLGRPADVRISMMNRTDQLVVRPMLYQEHPKNVEVALSPLLNALSVEFIAGEATGIDTRGRNLHYADGNERVDYDALVIATGSQVARPAIPGLDEHALDVDSLSSAKIFWNAVRCSGDGARIAVIGAGLTGLELVTEVASRTRCKTLLIDSCDRPSRLFSAQGTAVIDAALQDTETRLGSRVVAIDAHAVYLATGETIAADVVAWTAGMRAQPLVQQLGCDGDALGRVMTDRFLNVVPGVYAAGDAAHIPLGDEGPAPMSCQFAIPTGKLAGYNAMAELTDEPRQSFVHPNYVTCTDLGDSGALFTQGWERIPLQTGAQAKATKATIMQMIVPPRDVETLHAMALSDITGPTPDAD